MSKNDDVYIKNEELCVKNEDFCIQNDAFCRPDVDGVDLSPLFKDPTDGSKITKPNIAFSEYPRCAPPDAPWTPESYCGKTHDQKCLSPQSCVNTPRAHFTIMGYSVRTPLWRYTEWAWWDGANLVGDFSRDPAGETTRYPHHSPTFRRDIPDRLLVPPPRAPPPRPARSWLLMFLRKMAGAYRRRALSPQG